MKREKAYLLITHPSLFGFGRVAEIIGVDLVTPDGLEERPCYHIIFSDFVEDWLPINQEGHKVIKLSEAIKFSKP